MINYLNNPKRLFVALTTSVALAGSLTLASCQDYDAMDEDQIKAISLEATKKEFTKNFEERYGKIDPNHSWGFDIAPASFNNVATRALAVNVNRNEWYKTFEAIPGWPIPEFNIYQKAGNNNTGSLVSSINNNSDQPVGDVTDFEIQYVSRFFRTYDKNSKELKNHKAELHIADYFVQNVSADADQEAYTDANGTNIPAYPNGKNQSTSGPDKNGGYQNNNFMMDNLHCKEIGGDDKCTNSANGWRHVDSFNAGSTNLDPENHLGNTPTRVIQYVQSGGTEDFAYHPSMDDGSRYYDEWVLIKLEWDEPDLSKTTIDWTKINSSNLDSFLDTPSSFGYTTVHRVGYYLGFDFSGQTQDTKIEKDGYYSNWIIKISPATFKPNEGWPRRIMCEDLGNTCDFDFNDVVFDVVFQGSAGNYDAVITLRASGGTMPISVGGSSFNADLEAHKLLGAPNTSTPVNVGGFTAPHEIASYRIHNCTTEDLSQIKIYVNKQTAGSTSIDAYQISATEKGSNNAPQMFACPNTVRWLRESQYIETAYDHFKDWVQDEHGAYRENENDVNATTPWIKPWFNSLTDGANGHLFIK